MTRTFGRLREGLMSWGKELPPVIAVAGLAGDYISPAVLWTIWIPANAVVLLLAMRKWAHATTVFLLSSWVLIPTAAWTASAVEDLRGERRLYVIEDEE